jgi:CRISPR-associated protein Csb3
MNEIRIKINAENPVEYLACCGIFEIATRIDKNAEASWTKFAPTEFVLTTICAEEDLTHRIVQTFIDKNHWNFKNKHPKSKEVVSIGVDFSHNEKPIHFDLDWWYDSLDRNGKIKDRGAWKMYAGQQKAEKIAVDMIEFCRPLADAASANLQNLFYASAEMSGRFGFDPRSSRNALDVGYSPNDLNLPIATYPFLELLAMFGLQNFFPHRTSQSGGSNSCRGWHRRDYKTFFDYALWHEPLLISLARMFASGFDEVPEGISSFSSIKAKRKDYANLSISIPKN